MDEHFKNEEKGNGTSATNNDSMLDFRSPVLYSKGKLNELINYNVHKKLKATTKLKTIPKQHKGKELKKQLNKRKDMQESTPSIESSFFKFKDDSNGKDSSTDMKVALVCPLCFKIFKDDNSHTVHMKICAYKNNIPTKKLLDAIDLQKRQEDERKSLGLLAAPVVQARKKPALHKTNLDEESDLGLAIALSRSLQEAEVLNIIYENTGVPERSIQIESQAIKPLHEGQLEKFGFAHSKHPVLIKNKKKRCNTVTVLHTRSKEERIHILAKRISEILMADVPITQNVNKQSEQKYVIGEETIVKILKNHLLQDLFNKEARLWTEAQLSQDCKCFYVTNLSEHITPKENQEVEMNLEFTNTCNLYNMNLSKYTTEANKNEKNVIYTQSFVLNDECITCQDRQFTNSVINNWANILNNSSASDIIIFVSSGKHIWAHKLVFYAQCSNILLDVVPVVPNDSSLCNGIKDKICWMDIPYHIALAFLEFIYCGVIEKHSHIFEDISCFSFLRNLARKYRVKELFVLLNQKDMNTNEGNATVYSEYNREMVSKHKDLDLNSDNVERLIYGNKCNKSDKCGKVIKDDLYKFTIDKSEFTNVELKEDTKPNLLYQEKRNYMDDLSAMRNSNVSPDLFDEINDTLQSTTESRVKYADEILSTANENKDECTILLNSGNHVTTDIAMLSTSGSIVSSKNIEENIKWLSSPTPTTTPKRIDHSCIRRKPKSRLSSFFEHFEVKNEKPDSNNIPKNSVLTTTPKLCRNPFNIKQYNIFNEYSICNKNDISGVVQKERDISSMFHHVTSPNLPQINISHFEHDANAWMKFQSINNDIQLSKYNVATSTEPHKNRNSVSESSSATQKELEALYSTTTNLLNKSTKRSGNLHSSTFMRTFSATQYNNDKSNTFLDSDTDENEISMYSTYRRRHENNSIVKYRNFVQEQILKSNVKQNKVCDEYAKRENTENSSILQLNTNQVSEFEMIPIEEHDTLVHINNNKHTTNNQQTNLEYQGINNSSELKYSKSENNLEVLRKSSLSTKSDTNKHYIVTSPILLSSNIDSDDDVLNVNDFWENKMKKGTLHFEKSNADNHANQNDIYLVNSYNANDDDDSSDSSFIKEASNLNKEIVSIVEANKNCALHAMDNSPIKLKNSEELLDTKQNDRKFKENSLAQTSFCTNAKEIKNIVFAFCNNPNKTLCMCGHANYIEQHVSPEIVRNSVTPPPNYNNMLTPELHAELNKYGLKAQKRKRAIKLLTYIYNELHPMICMTPKKVGSELTIINSEEDEPPQKKIKSRKKLDLFHNYECQFPFPQKSLTDMQLLTNIIGEEEALFDKVDSTSVTDSIPNTRDMILKFLTVKKELHNKILMYDPLCINSLHSMLKVEGLKCSINTLMDFLDEQCIAFYIQEKSKQR